MLSDDFETRKKAESAAIHSLKISFFIGFLAYSLNMAGIIIVRGASLSTSFIENSGLFSATVKNGVGVIAFLSSLIFVLYFFTLLYVLSMDRSIRRILPIFGKFSVARWGIYLYAAGNFVYFPVVVFVNVFIGITTYPFLVLELSAVALMFTGYGLISVGLWCLGDHFDYPDMRLGSILLFLIPVVGLPLICSLLDGLIIKVERRIPPLPPPPWIYP